MHEIRLESSQPTLNGELLPQLIELFLEAQEGNVSPVTLRGYRAKLRYFVEWWADEGPRRSWRLDADILRQFEAHLRSPEMDLGWHTRHDALNRLKLVLRWAHARGYVPINFGEFVPEATGHPPVRKPIDLDILTKLIRAAAQSSRPLRNRAIIAVLAGTGIRRAECAGIQVQDVTLYADGSGYIFLSKTKGDKPRYVAFDQYTGRHIRALLDVTSAQYGPLFPSRTRDRGLSADGIYKLVVRLAEDAGVRDQITGPHDLRRMFATRWVKAVPGEGYGQLLQNQLGHANWSTTAIYSLQDVEGVLDVLRTESVSPMAQLARMG